ncbi:ATP-binding protein [Streptomyces flavidovirens]|uniref:ATP-binding protein n=1 Tax=Streptomyces flavidovirens TaxID=67298 RepID=UPI001AD8254E
MVLSDVLQSRGQTRRLTLCGTEDVVGRCRDFSREALADWQWIPAAGEEEQAVVDDVLLLVSEVVTNACLHAGGPREFVLNCTAARLRIEVTDGSPVHPSPRPSGVAAPGGHGLTVLRRLARSWGSLPRGSGKTVWVEVAAPRGSRQRGA